MTNWLIRNKELYTKFLSDEVSIEDIKKLYNEKI
jgi:hypothetical protein